jgi:nicotinate-nucleotide adenylyltransferase
MKKIGLILGSFDPIHIAHINIASCVLNSGLCDEILFVVAKHNPWKSNEPAPFDLRCDMVQLSITPFGGACKVCELEKDIEPPTYSYKVLTKIREQNPEDELYLITGTDAFNKLPGWKNWKTGIEPYFKVICVDRNLANPKDNGLEKDKAFVVGSFGCLIGQVDNITPRALDVSSTMIRNMVANGQNPYPLVTKEALNIINIHKLYKQ